MRSDDRAIAAYHAAMHGEFVILPKILVNKIGVDKSLLLKIVDGWCLSNKKQDKQYYLIDSDWWTQLSIASLRKEWPGIGSESKIKRLMASLDRHEFLLSFQSRSSDRTKFYRTNPVKLGKILLEDLPLVQNDPLGQNEPMEEVKMNPSIGSKRSDDLYKGLLKDQYINSAKEFGGDRQEKKISPKKDTTLVLSRKEEASDSHKRSDVRGKDSAPQSVKGTAKRSSSLGGLTGKRTDHRAIAKSWTSFFEDSEEEDGFYRWVQRKFDRDAENRANMIVCCLKNPTKTTPQHQDWLGEYRQSLMSEQNAPQQATLATLFESTYQVYKKDPSILSLPHREFIDRFGLSPHKFHHQLEKNNAV